MRVRPREKFSADLTFISLYVDCLADTRGSEITIYTASIPTTLAAASDSSVELLAVVH